MGCTKRISALTLFFLFVFSATLYSQTGEEFAPFVLKGGVKADAKPVDGVLLVLTKNDNEVTRYVTTSNGKFNIQIPQNTIDTNSYYSLTISKQGYVTKTLSVNTYIPEADYDDNEFVYTLEVTLIPTKISEIVIQRPYGKIKWNPSLSTYALDQKYYQTIAKEETLLAENPDKYLEEFAAKQRKELEEREKKLEEQQRLLILAKEKADSIERYKLDQLKKREIEEKSIVNSRNIQTEELKERPNNIVITKVSADKALAKPVQKTISPQKIDKIPLSTPKDTTTFDSKLHYSVNQEKARIQETKRKMQKNKAENLQIKYETNNMSTSLMNAVDAYDKKMKR